MNTSGAASADRGDLTGDAIWWGYVTATTVGYGDQYPVTSGGRLSGLAMLTVGVAVFATFSGFIATTLLAPRKPRVPEGPTSVDQLTALLDKREQTAAEIRAKLGQLQTMPTATLAQ